MSEPKPPASQFIHLAANRSGPRIGFALQGGGNHGAFTWGVMRTLLPHLEKKGFKLDGLIGDSAGAMNAVYAGYGWTTAAVGQKASGADFMMERLWWTAHREAFLVRQFTSARNLLDPTTMFSEMVRMGGQNIQSLLNARELMELTLRHPSLPMRPREQHHLEHVVGQQIDFKRLNQPDAPVVIVNTANVRDGGLDAFYGDKLSAKAVAGSGTLPELFNHMQIGEGSHWDGGFIANPPVQPLYNACPEMTDLFVVRVTPLHMRTAHMPRTDAERADRRMEMLLNGVLESELRWVHQHSRDTGRSLNIHVISVPDDWPHDLHSKVDFQNTHWGYYTQMRQGGEKAAKGWLKDHAAQIGRADTYHLPYRLHGERAGVPSHKHIKYG
jgi:NTE family protein